MSLFFIPFVQIFPVYCFSFFILLYIYIYMYAYTYICVCVIHCFLAGFYILPNFLFQWLNFAVTTDILLDTYFYQFILLLHIYHPFGCFYFFSFSPFLQIDQLFSTVYPFLLLVISRLTIVHLFFSSLT